MSNSVSNDLPEDRPETLNDATLTGTTPTEAAVPFVHERNGPDDSYGADQIQILEGLEAVRKRPGMYIGSTGPRGLHHLVYEVVDNSVDEALAGFGKRITVSVYKDGSVQVDDEGRGVPVDMHPVEKKPAVEVAFSMLHAGGTFSRSGASPGRWWNASSGISRRPALPSISTTASRAASGTQKSEGCVAMQCSLQPNIACSRLSPPRASQPAPGLRLLQALATS